MTRVDFYILDSADPSALLGYCCRLVEKAYRSGHRICIVTEDPDQQRHLDALLWHYRAEAFLPHSGDPDDWISLTHEGALGDHSDVLVNLGPTPPAHFSRFQRLAEIVCQEDSRLAASRERYSFYKHRGYPLHTHSIKA